MEREGPDPRREDEPALRALAILLIGGTPFVLVVVTLAGSSLWAGVIVAVGVAMTASILLSIVYWRTRHTKVDPLLRHNFGVCIGCGYMVDGLGEAGNCPECGRTFTRRALREYWLELYPDLRVHSGIEVHDA